MAAYSEVIQKILGIRRFGLEVSLLSKLPADSLNGNPLLKFLGNAFTGERIPQ